MADQLIIRGAREHNLKDVSLDLPRDALIVFTGLSGSGKSSLAFDTIFAEGQRRYVESLSAYARQFLGQMDKPDVDFIEGLSPAVSIDQKSTSKNPRSTVGTITEVYDYLRLLFARIGRPHCPDVRRADRAADAAADRRPGARARGGSPVPGARADDPRPQGRVRRPVPPAAGAGLLPGPGRRRDPPARPSRPSSTSRSKHTIEVVVDRLAVKESAKRRLTDSVETALNLAGGLVLLDFVDLDAKDPGRELRFSEKMSCPNEHPIDTDELEPRSFSFNSPFGACPECHGLGTRIEVDPELVVPDPTASLGEGAIQPWGQAHVADYFQRLLGALGDELGFDLDTPWGELTAKAAEVGAVGTPDQGPRRHPNRYGRERSYYAQFEGVQSLHRAAPPRGRVRHQPRALRGLHARGAVPGLRRLPAQADLGRRSPSASATSPRSARSRSTRPPTFLRGLDLTPREKQIAERVLKEINERLRFLLDVGLDYLSLDRPSGSLSGGEAQRIRLATQIGAGLVGVLYVLDEPSIGLHQRDNHRLIETLVRLKDLGNTLIVVEHDEDTIRVADWVVDIGPGAGEHGGQVVLSGSVQDLLDHPDSMTGAYLSGRREIPVPAVRRPPTKGRELDGPRRPRAQPAGRRRQLPARAASSPSPGCPAPASRRWSTTSSTPRWPSSSTARAPCRAGTAGSPASTRSTRSSTSTSRRSAAPRAPTRRPTPASSTTSASCSRRRPRRRCAATSRAGSRSTSRAAAARRAPATARSRSR